MTNDELRKLPPWQVQSFAPAQGAGGYIPTRTFEVHTAFPAEPYVTIPVTDLNRLLSDSDECARLRILLLEAEHVINIYDRG